MGSVKLAARLPDDEDVNGLDYWYAQLKRHPMDQVVAVVYFDVDKIVTDYSRAETHPVIRVAAVEIVGTIADAPETVTDAFQWMRDRRLASLPLPGMEVPTPPARVERIALTDGIDVEAALRVGEQDLEAPCGWRGHPSGDHDIDTLACTVEDCACSTLSPADEDDVVDADVIDPATGEVLEDGDDDAQ